ncbi:MAG: nucleotidyltransferase substrate binding protein [Endomicrobium sp.]|jgi:predicted transcriptional regulator|nr:nucleotidyltransferase substrate binding protein [Endomicrobium sp.]
MLITKLDVTKLEKAINSFEFTYELAWKAMKDYLEYMGINGILEVNGHLEKLLKLS